MTKVVKILAGAAGLAMVAGLAVPAAAQPYPPQPYPPGGYPGGGYPGGPGTVGQVIDQVLGGGRYGAYGSGPDRLAVDQCARAAEARVNGRGGYGGYGGYNQGYGNGNQGYGNQGYGQDTYGNYPNANRPGIARVVGITKVERRSNGLKVFGVIDSGRGYNRGPYGNQGYGNQGYGNQGYGNQGYGNQGYGTPYRPVADLRFDCRVDYRGYVRDIEIHRNNQAYRPY